MKRAAIEDVIRQALGHELADVSWRMPVPGGSNAPASAAPSARIADYVDHTLLKAEARRADIDTLCDEAAEHRFAAVCVNGNWVRLCAERLRGTDVKVATVVGFPLGAMATRAKAVETRYAVEDGADEVDMVVALGYVLDEDWDYVEDDITAVVAAAGGATVKVILETATLEPMQVIKAAAIAKVSGAHFVKTSTGFHSAGGATLEAVTLMKLAVGDAVEVKAAGGIRDCETALRMIAAGASRIGTSSGVGFINCIGAGPMPLADLLRDPTRHGPACRGGLCEAQY